MAKKEQKDFLETLVSCLIYVASAKFDISTSTELFSLKNAIHFIKKKLMEADRKMCFLHTVMVYKKVIAPNKVIFSKFAFSYENQIILETSCILNFEPYIVK